MRRIKKLVSLKEMITLLGLTCAGLFLLVTTGCGSIGINVCIPEVAAAIAHDAAEESLSESAYMEPEEGVRKYVMKQKLFSFGNRYLIKDETGYPVFFVKGKAFTIGNKLSFRDMDGKELAYIKEKIFSLKNKYKVYMQNGDLIKISKKMTFFKDKFTIKIPGMDDYQIKGNFWDYEYVFYRNGQKAAVVSKDFFTWGDTYGIQIAPGEEDVVILIAAVVIDLVSHEHDHHHHACND